MAAHKQDRPQVANVYVPKGTQVPAHCMHTKSTQFGKKIMVVGIMTGRGVLPLIRVPSKTKIDSNRYMDHVLTPLITDWLPMLYPGEMNKVFVHHYGATLHTSRHTQEELLSLSRFFHY